MPQYNFALVPVNQEEQFIQYATKLSYLIGSIDQYYLKSTTIPHVTICQFDEKEQDIDILWEKLKTLEHQRSIKLTFEKVRNTISAGKNWFLLIPNEIRDLKLMHKNALKIIKEPKSLYDDDYDPHLTLLNSRDLQKNDDSYKINFPLIAEFFIAITNRDEVGQAFKIIRCDHLNYTMEKENKTTHSSL
jgi:2'-5' RNA ligase